MKASDILNHAAAQDTTCLAEILLRLDPIANHPVAPHLTEDIVNICNSCKSVSEQNKNIREYLSGVAQRFIKNGL